MNMHEEYKGTRKKPQEEEEIKKYEDFFAVLNSLPDDLDEEVLKFRGVEADDILAWITQNVSDRYDHTWIVSSDRDLYQLVDENISIFNIFGRKEVTLQTMAEDFEVSPSEYMLSRIIEGDKSDNILGIEGIGPKRAQALAREYKTLDNLLEALPIKGRAKYIQNLNTGHEKLIRNEKLINLKKYCLDAITAGKQGEEPVEQLKNL
jgi:5'-3' exonuclease